MPTLELTGTISFGPDCATGAFPNGMSSIEFGTNCGCGKSYSVGTGITTRRINTSIGVFVALGGVGSGEAVTQARFLYLRSDNKINIRLTTKSDTGPDVVAVEPLQGLKIQEFPSDRYLLLLEVEGNATIEYLACGDT